MKGDKIKMLSFAKKISEEMGYEGELTEAVIKEVNRILVDYDLENWLLPVLIDDTVLERLSHDK